MKYTPILKGKRGELRALRQLRPQAESRTFATIELPPIPTKYKAAAVKSRCQISSHNWSNTWIVFPCTPTELLMSKLRN